MGLIKYVMALMNAARLGIGAQSVGIAEAAYREGLKYAQERKQFGKALIEFPAIYEMLSNMEAKLHGIRSVLYETARFVDMYKTYYHISKERALDKDERNEMKEYQKLADIYTPHPWRHHRTICKTYPRSIRENGDRSGTRIPARNPEMHDR